MEMHQLEYFVAVAEEGSFTRAAERIHISQSGVSAQIRQLERGLGAILIDRSGRTATLTAAGRAAIAHARAVLASADALRRSVDDVNGLVRGRLVVGMLNGSAVTGLFDVLAGFHAAHPAVEITLVENTADHLTERVRRGALDIAMIAVGAVVPRDLSSIRISEDRLVAAVPHDHRLARRKRIRLADIADSPVVCMPTGTTVRTMFDDACAAAGVAPTVALQASAPDAVAQLAGRGLGIAIVPASMAALHADRLHTLTIDDLRTPSGLALIWRDVPNPALAELVARCRMEFESVRSG